MASFVLLLLVVLLPTFLASHQDEEVYIVYMGSRGSSSPEDLLQTHQQTLAHAFGDEDATSVPIRHSYKHSFSGFSARLTQQKADAIAEMDGVVSVFKSKKLHLHTTRSWQFLGLSYGDFEEMWNSASGDVIIGVIDTGIWPESASFGDQGMGPVPDRWKGECSNEGESANSSIRIKCNKKIIGVRSYHGGEEQHKDIQDFENARDGAGHGTHTAATAAGRLVKDASLYGLCKGEARGGLPAARLAIYKVCFAGECEDDAVLAAFDDAIHDGVDMLSVSLGGDTSSFDKDTLAIGSFHAMRHGILVSCSAGNLGPFPSTIRNGAPWVLTVGATLMDRRLPSDVLLGDGRTLEGTALNLKPKRSFSRLVNAADIPSSRSAKSSSKFCVPGSLNASHVKHKIVLCHHSRLQRSKASNTSSHLLGMGASGLILVNQLAVDVAFSYPLPTTVVGNQVGKQIINYIKSFRNASAKILPTKSRLKIKPAPMVAVFSSRGPNTASPDILKPDVVAPGVNILAAWTAAKAPIKGEPGPKGPTVFNVLSGTSMACPHVTGAAAVLKSLYPDWSPAMIKSALMTTASIRDNANGFIKDYNGSRAGPFEYGAGEIKPLRASDPGLVYDISPDDYLSFLCGSYSSKAIRVISGDRKFKCAAVDKSEQLNYPTISVPNLAANKSTVVKRSVTNVGLANSVYKVRVDAPPSVRVDVLPKRLEFDANNTRLSYVVELKCSDSCDATDSYVFGSLTWSDGLHDVASTIVVKLPRSSSSL